MTQTCSCSSFILLYSKATPVPEKYAKSANGLPTMNSTPVILKSAIGSPTSILPCTDKIKFEVGKPNVDYEQYSQNSKVNIRFVEFHPLLYGHSKVEVGVFLADFSPLFCPMSSSLLKSTSSEVGVWTANFLLCNLGMLISY